MVVSIEMYLVDVIDASKGHYFPMNVHVAQFDRRFLTSVRFTPVTRPFGIVGVHLLLGTGHLPHAGIEWGKLCLKKPTLFEMMSFHENMA